MLEHSGKTTHFTGTPLLNNLHHHNIVPSNHNVPQFLNNTNLWNSTCSKNQSTRFQSIQNSQLQKISSKQTNEEKQRSFEFRSLNEDKDRSKELQKCLHCLQNLSSRKPASHCNLSPVFKDGVKYQIWQTASNNPGPGKYQQSKLGGKNFLIQPQHRNMSLLPKYETDQVDISEKIKSDNLFAVKYQHMNSSNFKQSPNLVRYSNKQLIKKLLPHISKSVSHQSDDEETEYVFEFDKSPGPSKYKPKVVEGFKKSSNDFNFISNCERFPAITECSPVSSYLETTTKDIDTSQQSSFFVSKQDRFQNPTIYNHKLQYHSQQNSHIKNTKNKKLSKFPFESGTLRTDYIKEDPLPFYDHVQTFHRPACSWAQLTQHKGLKFDINQNPGPGYYKTTLKRGSRKQNFSKATRDLFQSKNKEKQKRENKENKVNFIMMEEKKDKKKVNKSEIRKDRKNRKIKGKPEKLPQKYLNEVHNVPQIWSKKFLHKKYSQEILPSSNNPFHLNNL